MWEYPLWEVPRLGGGMVVAFIATTHVLLAHFSVGAGIILPFAERRARRADHQALLLFLKRFSKAILIVGFIFGAVTGVGIWFSISIVATRATSMLIHNFVWFWAIEWVFFLVEIIAGYAYYATWDRIAPRRHVQLAWVYAVSAWFSLFVISGILAFMLSPGKWLETGNIWHAFFNPTFWPTVALRTVSSLALGALAGMVIVNLYRRDSREDKTQVINYLARFLWPMVLMLPFAFWYFEDIPVEARNLLAGGAAAMSLFFLFGIAASTLVGAYAYFGLIRAKRYINLETAMLLLSIAVIATVSMEFVREGIRKPYILHGRLYSNGLAPEEVEKADTEGVLARAPWARLRLDQGGPAAPSLGGALYAVQCAGCHVEKGFNDVAPLVRGWSRELLEFNLERLHELKPFMPPVVGTAEEREALADYLWALIEPSEKAAREDGLAANESGSRS